jgi:two-component system, NarL family, response regulator LiaR
MKRSVIRVLIVDDHAIVRKGVRAFFEEVEDIDVVGDAGDGEEAVAHSRAVQPDVILMDLVMPDMNGAEAISRITATHEKVRIIALTSYATDDLVFPALKSGAMGYILKDSEPEELVKAIRQVHSGESSLDPSIARKVLQEISRPSKKPPTPDPLTERE